MGENKFDKNVEIVIYEHNEVSKHFSLTGSVAEWLEASAYINGSVLQRFESYIPPRCFTIFSKITNF